MKIDINNREELNNLLDRLFEEAEAHWGLMKPQHMIEHLATTMKFSNGKMLLTQRTTEQEGKAAKEVFIYTDMEMAKGIKSSLMGDVPNPFQFSSLEEAKRNLNQELDHFHTCFQNNPCATFIHPRLGSLNYSEWVTFHNKHFTHHFKQFGLL